MTAREALQSPEFWAWAQGVGLIPRGPRGSLQNRERARQIPGLVRRYLNLFPLRKKEV